jgi:hypothetical protein
MIDSDMRLRLAHIVDSAIAPALRILPAAMDTPQARLMMLAIGLQESRFTHRAQVLDGGGKGPARGFWQFEEGTRASRGGVWGVYLHPASNESLRVLCRALDVSFEPRAIWAALESNDVLAAGVARLMLWTDAQALPKIGEASRAWYCYTRTWRPGKPHPDTWLRLYACALEALA